MVEIKTCCVTGHRSIPLGEISTITQKLKQEVLLAIRDGYTHFISGFALGADLLFADIIVKMKKFYPITLEAAIPYPGRMRTLDQKFQSLIACCDTVKIHSDHYFKGCYMYRNRYMVDQSQRIIAVYDGRKTGGTIATLRYAQKKEIHIVWS